MRILVTGAFGFSGRHLIAHLRASPDNVVIGVSRTARSEADHEVCDLLDPRDVARLVNRVRPERVFHLAGTFTNDLRRDLDANVIGTHNLLQAIGRQNAEARVLLVGSAAEYGPVPVGLDSIPETQPLFPASVYGLTKMYQTLLGQRCVRLGMNIVFVRPFNLFGLEAPRNSLLGEIEHQVAELRSGVRSKIVVGDLSGWRDYLDADVAVQCYSLVMAHGDTGKVYNVGSGTAVLVRDVAARLLAIYGLAGTPIEERVGERIGLGNAAGDRIQADVGRLRDLIHSNAPDLRRWVHGADD